CWLTSSIQRCANRSNASVWAGSMTYSTTQVIMGHDNRAAGPARIPRPKVIAGSLSIPVHVAPFSQENLNQLPPKLPSSCWFSAFSVRDKCVRFACFFLPWQGGAMTTFTTQGLFVAEPDEGEPR